jgi:3-hydroxyisobutyrate dehydrogenase-like beta-hydroxyacid dehydrogenase
MKIAFVGLGNMGAPMARNLLRAGHEVTVYNRTREKAEQLTSDGARLAGSASEAVAGCEAAISMLADDTAVRGTVFGHDGFIQKLPAGAIHISSSTISVELSKHLAEYHSRFGQGYVAAPVLGRPDAAEASKLWIIAAGPEKLIERCRPLFDALGRGLSVVGREPWQANMVKIAANFTLASMLETLGEAAALMRKTGISVHQFNEVVNSLFQSPVYAGYGKLIADEKYEPAGFRLKLGLKDVGLALAAAGAEAVPMPLASLLRDHYLEAVARGYGEQDWSAVARVVAGNAGL